MGLTNSKIGANERILILEKEIKMTAPYVPEATGTEQSSQEYCKQSISNSEKTVKTNNLETITMRELNDKSFIPHKPVIDGLLNYGVNLLVGPPKIGKSFMVADLSVRVSKGEDFLNRKTHQGEVLYLALEDDFQRLQQRFYRMFDVEDTPNLHLAVASDSIKCGLEAQIGKFLDNHKEVTLVVIDTLQKIRGNENETVSYSKDYEVISILKKIAEQYNICMLLVHHTRKQEAVDIFDTISGTNGLLGAADGSLVINKDRRSDNRAKMAVSGRDIPYQELTIEFDKQKCLWKFVEETDPYEEPKDELLEKISKLVSIDNPVWEGTATDIVSLLSLDMKANVLSRKLNPLSARLYKDYSIFYENSHKKENRYIRLELKVE